MNKADTLYGLTPDVIEKIQGVFAQFDAIDRVILYGSRAKGNYRPGSDIDLALKTDGGKTDHLLLDVVGAIENLDLIYKFDICLFSKISNDDLRAHISRVGLEFYQRDRFRARRKAQQQQAKRFAAARESEQTLENKLIAQLETLGFEKVQIDDERRLSLTSKNNWRSTTRPGFLIRNFARSSTNWPRAISLKKPKSCVIKSTISGLRARTPGKSVILS